MTKPRTPLTTGAALDRVAGQLPGGYAELAVLLEKSEGVVRAWGDPDRREDIPFRCAIAADLVYREAGGEGAPLFDTYAFQLDLAGRDRFAREVELGRLIAASVRETGEAHGAALAFALPGSRGDARQLSTTIREAEEAIAAWNSVLQSLRAAQAADAGVSDKHGHEATAPP